MSNLSQLEERVAVDIFKADVRRWADRIGVEPKEIHVREMKRKWASCSSRGRLRSISTFLVSPRSSAIRSSSTNSYISRCPTMEPFFGTCCVAIWEGSLPALSGAGLDG